jgi:cardiolipin synthase
MASLRRFKNGHHIELLRSGRPYFTALVKAINEAKRYIHFQIYLVEDDPTGRRIINALIRAAQRSVKVYLLLDAYGSPQFTGQWAKRVEDAGILVRKFSPKYFSKGLKLSLRLHHKVLLVDGELAILGGLNLADRYYGTPGKKAWLDFAIKIQGPECVHILEIVKRHWNKKFIPYNKRSHEVIEEPVYFNDGVRVRVLVNNWYRRKIEILRSYRSAFRHSRERVILFASYFLPGRNERRLLKNASMRGVDIRIVLAAESDVPMFRRATNFLYDFILRNNIRIYEYLPSNLHAKVATVDGKWCTIGSYNLNHLSDYGSIEMNADILDEKFSGEFEKVLENIIRRDCRRVTIEELMRRKKWFYRLTDWFSYQLIRLMMRIMFVLSSKK